MYKKLGVFIIRLYNSFFRNSGVYIKYSKHNLLSTYYKKPPINYVLKRYSKLNHYINHVPLNNSKPFIIEFEHILFLSGHSREYKKMINSVLSSKKLLESDLCKAIIVWSKGTIREIEKYIDISSIEDKIHIIRPASNLKNCKKENDNSTFTFLNIGNKFWAKGTFIAIEAFKKFNFKYPNSKFYIVCNDIPSDFKLSKNIITDNDPMMKKEKKEKLFNKSDIFLFPCLHDSYGVYIETLTHGLPMISSDIYDKDEIIIDEKCGFLIKPPFSLYEYGIGVDYKNYSEFISLIQQKYKSGEFDLMINKMVEKMEYLHNNREELPIFSKNCHDQLIKNFSLEKRNEELKEIYTEILKDL